MALRSLWLQAVRYCQLRLKLPKSYLHQLLHLIAQHGPKLVTDLTQVQPFPQCRIINQHPLDQTVHTRSRATRHQPPFRQVGADRVVALRARLQRLLAKTMQHRQILLRNRLDRHRMQPWSLRSLDNRHRILASVLLFTT